MVKIVGRNPNRLGNQNHRLKNLAADFDFYLPALFIEILNFVQGPVIQKRNIRHPTTQRNLIGVKDDMVCHYRAIFYRMIHGFGIVLNIGINKSRVFQNFLIVFINADRFVRNYQTAERQTGSD